MKAPGKTVKEILANVPEERREPFNKLHNTIVKNLPKGFEAAISYGGLGYVVPHTLYPAGYHCDPKLPLPFISIAAQKNFYAFYHMGLYADAELMKWFTAEFARHSAKKPDMGKSCVRFKNAEDIPLKLIGQLVKKIAVKDWIARYEQAFRSGRKK